MKTKILKTTKEDIARAGKILREGGLVAFPTETVYGLGASIYNDEAVANIYKAKGRPSDNPLIVHIAEKEDIIPLVKEVTPKAQRLIDAFFPAPLTVILPKSDRISKTVSGGLDTVGIRMPQNPIARAVIKEAGVPIAAPSANTSGLPSPTDAKYVIEDLNGRVDAVIDGGSCEFGIESTVITLAEEIPVILRPGAVTKEMLEEVIGEVKIAKAVTEGMKDGEAAASPGMKYKHYAPKAKIIILNADKEKYEKYVNMQKDAFALCYEDDEVSIPRVTFGREGDDLSQSHALFNALRRLDELGAQKVYARNPKLTGVGLAVYNRLIRAAAFCVLDLEKPFLIGLTGQTGAGKGYICESLKKAGFNIVDADYYSKKITEKGSPVLSEIQREFGADTVTDGVLNRNLLAERAFESPEKTQALNKIMHPAILDLCISNARFPCVFDAPQLFESGADALCAKIVCVTAPYEVRLERIMKRDGISRELAEKRISAQHSEEFFSQHSDFTVINDGRNTDEQIKRLFEEIM